MSLTAYQQALDCLLTDVVQAVEAAFASWSLDVELRRVSQNVADETALSNDHFTRLLDSFATQLAQGEMPVDAWQIACRDYKLKGKQILAGDCPTILGRAKGLDDHAASIAEASLGMLTPNEAKKLLLKHSGSLEQTALFVFLRDAPLGKYIVWATFNSVNSNVDPFDSIPGSCDGIRTALGLGHVTTSDSLIALVWSHVDSGSPPLYRPTVADAEDYSYYRPCTEADILWGLTEPLPPNPDGLRPQPEVVMPETTSQGLRLPFRVV